MRPVSVRTSWIFFTPLALLVLLTACSAKSPANDGVVANQTEKADPGPTGTMVATKPVSPAPEEVAVRTAPFIPLRSGRVFIFAGVDETCRPTAPPALSIKRPPSQGNLSFKEGQQTVIAASARGTCLGTKASGTGVYYTARAGASGSDTFTVIAQMPSGEKLERAFTVTIAQ